MPLLQAILLVPLLAALIVAAVIDLRARRIPNWLTATLAIGGLAAAVTWQGALVNWWQAALGAVVGLLVNWPLFALRIRGGGDVKLFAAVGTWVGPVSIIVVFVLATLVAMVVAIAQAVAHRRLRPVMRSTAELAVGLAHGAGGGLAAVTDEHGEVRSVDRHLPYAVPIGIAVLALVAMG